jgi:predicted LPLAT superfamily acyltransferase
MDKRQTLHGTETFLEQLQAAFKAGEKVHLLVDKEGIERTEGIIKDIHPNAQPPVLNLQNGDSIPIQQIVAVNGIFRPEYGEC